MKDDVKKLLAEHRDEILPDARVKEKVRRDLGLSSVTESRMAYARGGEHALTDGRKAAVALIAVLLVAAIFLCIFLPIWLQRGGAPTPGGDIGVFGDADSFYAYGAASVGAILSSGEGSASSSPHAVTADAAVAAAEVYPVAAADAAQVEILNKYLSLVESLLGGSGITGESVAPAEGYEFGMRVTRVDLLGGHDSYELYYNKRFLGSETDGDETEENYSITGVLVTDGGTYRVSGTYQTESEEDGRESELFFRAYTGDSADSYIEFRQSQESEHDDGDPETEAEYVYTVVTDGVRRERTVVEYEGEADETELSMVIDRYDADGSRISREQLFFEDETEDGVRVILVRGTLDGEAVVFRIYVRGDGYDYVFSDGTHIPGDRYDDDDDDDDDWDD